jgi:hypothetical protein
MCMPTYQIQTRVYVLHVYLPIYLHSSAQRNSTYHAQTCPTTTHSCEQAMYCTHSSAWSVELWASAAAMCCAPSSPMEFPRRLYAHVCVRNTIQRTCADHDVRSHSHNRERGHIHPCICVCRHTKYKHVCMSCTYTYLPSLQCTTQQYISCTNMPHYYALMRAGYVLHSL